MFRNFVEIDLKADSEGRRRFGNVRTTDDFSTLSVLPIEVKSGKDYKVHSAIDAFLITPDYHVRQGIVFSNERQVLKENGVLYMPIYYSMFLKRESSEEIVIPVLKDSTDSV